MLYREREFTAETQKLKYNMYDVNVNNKRYHN